MHKHSQEKTMQKPVQVQSMLHYLYSESFF